MNRARLMCRGIVPACWVLLVPSSVLQAAQGDGSPAPAFGDVALDEQGDLQGVVVNIQGIPVAGAQVTVRQNDREVARTQCDAKGHFSVGGLRGGTYLIIVGDRARVVRAPRRATFCQ